MKPSLQRCFLSKFVRIGRVEFGIMGNTAYWYLLPTIEWSSIAPVLAIDIYFRFLCFSFDVILHRRIIKPRRCVRTGDGLLDKSKRSGFGDEWLKQMGGMQKIATKTPSD